MWRPGERPTAATGPGNRTNDIASTRGVIPCGFPDFLLSRASVGAGVPKGPSSPSRFRAAGDADQSETGFRSEPHRHDSRTIHGRVPMCITDRAPAQTRVAARFPRGALILFLASETENSFSTFAEGENAPQVGRSYPNAARDRPRCRRGGRGGRTHAQGARTECHGERGARDPPFFPFKTENSNIYW